MWEVACVMALQFTGSDSKIGFSHSARAQVNKVCVAHNLQTEVLLSRMCARADRRNLFFRLCLGLSLDCRRGGDGNERDVLHGYGARRKVSGVSFADETAHSAIGVGRFSANSQSIDAA